MSHSILRTLLLPAFLGASTFYAQSEACANALDVCGQTDFTASLDTPLDLPGADSLAGVFEATYMKVVHFHTTFFNSINSDPTEQTVELLVNELSCEGAVQARLFEANTFDPCNTEDHVVASELWTLTEGAVFSLSECWKMPITCCCWEVSRRRVKRRGWMVGGVHQRVLRRFH